MFLIKINIIRCSLTHYILLRYEFRIFKHKNEVDKNAHLFRARFSFYPSRQSIFSATAQRYRPSDHSRSPPEEVRRSGSHLGATYVTVSVGGRDRVETDNRLPPPGSLELSVLVYRLPVT